MLKSDFGAGPWDAVSKNFSILTGLSLGLSIFIVSTSLIIIVLSITRKLELIFMVLPAFLIALSVETWNAVLFDNFVTNHADLRLFLYINGVVFIPFGLALIISSRFPAFVFDELMIMLMSLFKTNKLALVRAFVELTGITLAIIFGLLHDGGLGAVGYGSIFLAIVIGPLLSYFMKILNKEEVKIYNMNFSIKNIFIYLMGAIIISLGVVLMFRSNMGNSSWDTLHYSLHALTNITLGDATIYVALTFTFLVTVGNRDLKYIGMVLPIMLVGKLIDFFDLYVLINYFPKDTIIQLITYILGLLFLPLGGSLLIISSFPAGVFDEFMLTVMRILKTDKLVRIRVIMELSAVALAILLGFIAGVEFGKVSWGTLVFSLSVGLLIRTYLRLFERFGLYELKK